MELNSISLLNDASLQGYWKLEAAGTDETSNNNDLTETGSPSYVAGIFGNGVDLEGSTPQYLSITDASQTGLDISGDISFSAWIKIESLGSLRPIMTKYDSGNNTRAYRFDVDASGQIELDISSDGTVATGKFLQFKSDEDVVEAGVWYHVATTFDISTETCTMYLNGSAIDNSITLGSSVGATIYNSAAPFAIGQDFTNGSSGNDYDGIIDDAAIFSRVLTGSEVATLFNLEPAISDSIAVTESATLDVPVNSAISDSVTLTESAKMTLVSGLVPTESITVSEYVDVTIRDGLQISIWQENITVTDKPEFPGPRDKSFEENITVTESVTVKITDESNDAKPNIKVEY